MSETGIIKAYRFIKKKRKKEHRSEGEMYGHKTIGESCVLLLLWAELIKHSRRSLYPFIPYMISQCTTFSFHFMSQNS